MTRPGSRCSGRCATGRCGGWPGCFAATLATSIVTVHLVVYLREQRYSAGFAATWTGLLGAMSVTGRIAVTGLGRRWSLAAATAAIFASQALAVAVLILPAGRPG